MKSLLTSRNRIPRRAVLLGLVLVHTLVGSALAQTYPGQIGVGIGLSQWNKAFVDIVKESRGFEAIGGDPVPMDGLGWPLADARLVLLEAWPVAEWSGDIDDPDAYHTLLGGTYQASFTGQADVSRVWGDFTLSPAAYDAPTNTTTFQFTITDPANGFVLLEFLNTRRTPGDSLGSGFTDLKVIRPGYALNTTQVYNDDFLNALQSASFSTVRFMGFTFANNTNPTYPDTSGWADRKTVNAATFRSTGDGVEPGCPWEHVVELGNILDVDIWINVPVAATDYYVEQLATLVRDNLEPGRAVYVELSNEVWNWSFTQSQWNLAEANALGISHIDAYAKRTAELALIFQNVFGPGSLNDRVRVVNCWQIGWWPPDVNYNQQMSYIDQNFGPPKDLIYGLGVAPYFNCGGACSNGSVQDILDAMTASTDNSVVSRQLVTASAAQWQLPGGMLSYEGGSDTGGGDTANVANRIRAERSASMKDIMIHDLRDNWFPHGGGLFMYLELAGGYNRYGSWGLTDEIADPDRNHKFCAVRELLGDVVGVGSDPRDVGRRHLLQNVPNPWCSRTSIGYQLDTPARVSLSVFDLAGRKVKTLVEERQLPGNYAVDVEAEGLPSGVYVYRLRVGNRNESRKFVVVR